MIYQFDVYIKLTYEAIMGYNGLKMIHMYILSSLSLKRHMKQHKLTNQIDDACSINIFISL